MKVTETHTFMLTPMKNGTGGIARPVKLERATLDLGVREGDNTPMVKLTNRCGEVMHLEMDAALALHNMLSDLLAAGKLGL